MHFFKLFVLQNTFIYLVLLKSIYKWSSRIISYMFCLCHHLIIDCDESWDQDLLSTGLSGMLVESYVSWIVPLQTLVWSLLIGKQTFLSVSGLLFFEWYWRFMCFYLFFQSAKVVVVINIIKSFYMRQTVSIIMELYGSRDIQHLSRKLWLSMHSSNSLSYVLCVVCQRRFAHGNVCLNNSRIKNTSFMSAVLLFHLTLLTCSSVLSDLYIPLLIKSC